MKQLPPEPQAGLLADTSPTRLYALTHLASCPPCLLGPPCPSPPPQVSIVAEQLLRLLHHCGMPRTDADLIHGGGRVVNELLLRTQPRSTLFTGSQRVAEKLALDLKGKVGQGRGGQG